MKRGAVGLSINTLVVVIISIVVLGGGIALMYKFIGSAQDVQVDLDQQTQAELDRLLITEQQPVALPRHVANLRRGDDHVFGIGIHNIGAQTTEFRIDIEPSRAYDFEGQEIDSATEDWYLHNDQVITVQEAEVHKESIFVQVPDNAPSGQYIFNAEVINIVSPTEEKRYGNRQKFIVNVK